MIIDLNDPNPPIKIVVGMDGEDETYLMLRPAAGDVLEKIRKKTHTRKFKNVHGVVHEYFEVDEKTYDFLLWEYCLTGWGGWRDAKDDLIEYSPQVAADLISASPFFAGLIGDKLDEVKEIIDKRVRAAEKN